MALLAHSAGGWLGRVWMKENNAEGVDMMVSLGSPHNPVAPGPGVIDQTRGLLTWCETNCPGAYHPHVQYFSVAGTYIKGAGWRDEGSVAAKVVGAGYQQVCGSADVEGDGVVPVVSALLEGSKHIVLEGAYHSPLGSVDMEDVQQGGEEAERKGRQWYGSPSYLEEWVGLLM